MNYQVESKILKALAIAALAAAMLTMLIIIVNTGVVGGDSSATSEAGGTEGVATTSDAAAAEATATTATRTHVVEDGDSFYSIARKYDTSISEIQKLNPNIDPQHLTAGIRLAIP